MPPTAGDHRGLSGESAAPVQVQITVIAGPRGPTLREHVGAVGNRRVIGCLVAATVAAGALVAGVSLIGRGGAASVLATTALPTTVLPNTVLYPTYLQPRGPRAAVSPASAYPLRCLRLLIAMHDPSLRNAAFDRNLPCGHARGPYTLIAIGARRSGGARTAPRAGKSPRG